jgi:RNA polymerase sigma-70 factor (ECF subfamily)
MTLGEQFEPTLQAARRGEEQAIAALYSDANPSLLRYLRAREPHDADDLASEIWISLARQIPDFDGDERHWWGLVFLVARRCLNDHWKRRRRRRTEPADAETFAGQAGQIDVEATGIQSIADREALALVTATLSPDQADVILLRVVAGLDVDEVATAIGKRPGTVRVIQHRALRKLAEQLVATRSGALGTRSARPSTEASPGPGPAAPVIEPGLS